MIYLLTNKLKYIIKFFFVIIFFIFFSKECFSCDLLNTPLTRQNKCVEFSNLDKKLNFTYRILIKKLNKSEFENLKKIQKNWIEWRDQKCDEIQRDARCDNAFCDGVEHDDCIVSLTNIRLNELKEIYKNLDTKKLKNFAFSKNSFEEY